MSLTLKKGKNSLAHIFERKNWENYLSDIYRMYMNVENNSKICIMVH